MKKLLKIIGIIVGVIILLLVIFTIYHKIMLKIEEKSLVPNGKIISAFDTDYHIYVEGNGEKTIILLSGWGITSPVYEYKTLYSKLSDEYKIVIIEKPGNGYSKETKRERNLKNILEEYKYILEKEKVEGPYVLMAHSAGGIEALYWLQNYPNEVEKIISLDMNVPEQSEYVLNYQESRKTANLISNIVNLIGSRTGLTRISAIKNMSIDSIGLNDNEYRQNELLWYKNAYSNNVIKEEKGVFLAGKEINENVLNYNLPVLEFFSGDVYNNILYEIQSSFFNKFKNNKEILLNNAHHSMYRTESEKIASEIKEFLSE